MTHFELLNHNHNGGDNNANIKGLTSSPITTNSIPSRRSSSIVSDMAHSSFGNKASIDYSFNGGTHRRNLSQNSSFNSPLLTPSTRFSISSTTSLMNHQLTTTTSPNHKHNDFYSKNRSGSVFNGVVQKEQGEIARRASNDVKMGDGEEEKRGVVQKDGESDHDTTPKFSSGGVPEGTKSPDSETRKMSVAALLE